MTTNGSLVAPPDLFALVQRFIDLSTAEAINLENEFKGGQPPLLLAAKGKELKDLTPYFEAWFGPRRVAQRVRLVDVGSVIAYLKRFKVDDASSVFLDPGVKADEEAGVKGRSPTLRAVIDYHAGPDKPALGRHVVDYDFPFSDELKAWLDVDGVAMSQSDVVEHLLDRENDIANPPASWLCVEKAAIDEITNALNLIDDLAPRDENGSYLIPKEVDSDPTARVDEADERWAPRLAIQKLAEIRFAGINTMKRLAGGLELTSSSRAKSTYDHKTGARTIEFEDERDAKINGNKVTLPDFFLLSIPLFQGDPPSLLPVRPVVRFGGGSLKWGFILAHIDRVIARRVRRVGDEIAETTGVPVYFGAPS